MVETSGTDLSGQYVGEAKVKVQAKMEEARGGVLFIDEAYDMGEGHYGKEAMTKLLGRPLSLSSSHHHTDAPIPHVLPSIATRRVPPTPSTTGMLTEPEYMNGRTVVIMAGYETPMHTMLGRNTGLKSRFSE